MNANELRALADALPEGVHWSDPITPDMLAEAIKRFCADAQPVAWRCEVRGDGTRPALGASDWRHYATTTNERTAQAFLSRCGDGIEGRVVPLTAAPAAPQAEPKREPLPGLAPTHRCPACGALWRQCDDASWNLRSASCCGLCDAGRVELVCWLDEPKRGDRPVRDLLAIIHCDGGHHTEAVGLDQSILDAMAAVCELKGRLAMEMREPGSEQTDAQIDYRALYHDLLFAVGNKHAGETRHETALRYIREAERSDGAALAVKETK